MRRLLLSALGLLGAVPYDPDVVDAADHGAIGDGVADDTAALQSAIREAVGGTCVIPPGAFRITASIDVPGGTRIEAFGARLLHHAPGDYTPAIRIAGVADVRVRGLEIDGRKADYPAATEHRHNLLIKQSRNVHLEDLDLHDAKGDGVYIGADEGGHSENVTLENVRCDANHRQGCSITDLRTGRFTGCRFTGTGGTAPGAGLDVEPNRGDAVACELVFEACEFTGNAGAGFLGRVGPSTAGRQENWTLLGCTIAGNKGDGILLEQCSRVRAIGCTVEDNAGVGVRVADQTEGVEIAGGSIARNGHQGVFVYAGGPSKTCIGLKISGATIMDNSTTAANARDGIRIDWSRGAAGGCLHVVIAGCTIRNGSGRQRYAITTSENVRHLKVIGCYLAGITGPAVYGDDEVTRVTI